MRRKSSESKNKASINIRSATNLNSRIKSVLKRSPEPAIALSAVFEALGYNGLTGIGWGLLAGFIVSVAMELGYEVREIGGRYLLFKTKNN